MHGLAALDAVPPFLYTLAFASLAAILTRSMIAALVISLFVTSESLFPAVAPIFYPKAEALVSALIHVLPGYHLAQSGELDHHRPGEAPAALDGPCRDPVLADLRGDPCRLDRRPRRFGLRRASAARTSTERTWRDLRTAPFIVPAPEQPGTRRMAPRPPLRHFAGHDRKAANPCGQTAPGLVRDRRPAVRRFRARRGRLAGDQDRGRRFRRRLLPRSARHCRAFICRALPRRVAAAPASAGRPFAGMRRMAVGRQMLHGEYVWNEEGVPPGRIRSSSTFRRRPCRCSAAARRSAAPSSSTAPTRSRRRPAPSRSRRRTPTMTPTIYEAPHAVHVRLTGDGIAIHGSNVRYGWASRGCVGVPIEFAELPVRPGPGRRPRDHRRRPAPPVRRQPTSGSPRRAARRLFGAAADLAVPSPQNTASRRPPIICARTSGIGGPP